jgi:murein DD-endopeptidase MepM/ murein hydrolase activator NlpD
MADDKRRVELEVGVKDTGPSMLEKALVNFEAWVKRVNEGTTNLAKFTSGVTTLGTQSVQVQKSLSSISDSLVMISKTMLGVAGNPVVIAATAAVAATTVLNKFSATQAEMKKLATDSGFSLQSIREISNTFEMMGYEYARGGQFVSRFGEVIKSTRSAQREDKTYIALSQMGKRGRGFAEEYLKKVNDNVPPDQIFEWISEEYIRQGQRTGEDKIKGEQSRLKFETLFAEGTVMQNFARARGRIVVPYRFTDDDLAKQEKFNQFFLQKRQEFHKVWQAIEGAGVNAIMQNQRDKAAGKPAPTAAHTLLPTTALPPFLMQGTGMLLNFFSGRGSSKNNKTSTDIGGSARRANREDLTPEREQNRLLDEIRISLQRIELGGSDDAGAFTGGGRAGLARRLGMYSGGGGSNFTGSSMGALAGTVHGRRVDAFGNLAGQTIHEPMTAASLGGGLGGTSAKFGPGMHEGIDIMNKVGTPVYSPMPGRVVSWNPSANGVDGSMTIEHYGPDGKPNGVYSRFLHQAGSTVKVGDVVTGGQQVAVSGYRNAPHSHFEMWRGPPSAGGSALMNPRAIYGWNKDNLPQGGRAVTALGPDAYPGGKPIAMQGSEGAAGSALFRAAVEKFKASPLNGYVPKDGAQYGIVTGSPEEWARLAVALGRQESSLNPNVRNGLFQFGADDLARYGVSGSVNDPDAQLQATVNQFSRSIPASGYIGGRGEEGWRGGAKYFEPIRYPGQLNKHWGYADQVAKSSGATGAVDAGFDVNAAYLKYQDAITPKAVGGPVFSGHPYLVGEQGPEIIVPSSSGMVIPNHDLGKKYGDMIVDALAQQAGLRNSRNAVEASIRFVNVPPGIKTSVTSGGPVRLSVSKQRAMGRRYG